MKNIKKIAFLFLSVCSLLFVACDEKGDSLTGGSKTGGLLNVKKEAITYVVGNGLTKPYDNQITIFQGVEKVVKIDIYKSFTSTKVVNGVKQEVVSNQILLKTITPLANVQTENVNFSTNYNELIAGLFVGNDPTKPLPAADSSLMIGDYFTLVYKSTLNNGLIHENAVRTKLSVGTRFAGTYRVIQSLYWRINTPRPDILWEGQTRIIESVDATTYRFLQYAGPFGPPTDNTHYFTVDANDVVRTPVSYNGAAQILNSLPVINCEETPSNMINACSYAGPQNTIVRDDVNGRDRIYRCYGYLNTTGPREFYEVLEKIVD